jgi:hypothetical protein
LVSYSNPLYVHKSRRKENRTSFSTHILSLSLSLCPTAEDPRRRRRRMVEMMNKKNARAWYSRYHLLVHGKNRDEIS